MPAKKTTKKEGTFAVIQTGGKQYLVTKGEVFKTEKMTGISTAGEKVVFDKVLLIDDGTTAKIGLPYVSGATVEGKLVEEGKSKKVNVVKYLQKSRYLKTRGHRQPYAKIEITKIS